MSDIELVIKIPEAEYDLIVNDEACGLNVLTRAIAHGTLLPKGHGRLGDLDALDNGLREQQRSYEHTFGIRQPINEAVRDGIIMSRCHIDHAPTIIEADKESEEV